MTEPRLLVLPGMEEIGEKILSNLRKTTDFDEVRVDFQRIDFNDGTSKVKINSSIYDTCIFILVDPYNYGVTYKMRGNEYPVDPDKHIMTLQRTISAIQNDAKIVIIMPMLYAARQDKRDGREDLITSKLLHDLDEFVKRIITFDIHSDGFQNAMAKSSLNSFSTTSKILESYFRNNPDATASELFVLGTDEGALKRAIKMSEHIGEGCKYGTCIKVRNTEEQTDGVYNVDYHEFVGDPYQVKGKRVLITDDMIDSGGSIIGVLEMLQDKGCKTVDIAVSFGLFTKGIEKFKNAKGLFQKLYVTNSTYLDPELKNTAWVEVVDISETISEVIKAITFKKPLERFF